ncbi:superoxide dismutase [Cu-Zn] SodC [Endozoicomonas sp. ONNA2]|uniref:superoxide dismutase [Cu-Zn] SodC n=1 Tax=Endozoicomonas sp. ONNA2 TaxID=2828741 RepID=UPI0027D21A99|nr:superoxide dismutase [Cu-Zn] SodC [Endozoicomonas sp. ONNA2]
MVNKGIRFLALPITVSALLLGCSNNSGHVEDREEEKLEVVMFRVTPTGNGPTLGSVFIQQGDDVTQGVRLHPALHDLPPGEHGFHVHENPSCEPRERDGQSVAALGAGGHYDPDSTGHHEGPAGHGHLGDLPVLMVDANGQAVSPIDAPRLSLSQLKGRSLVIHAGADNYSDTPPLGGGGARIACGIIQ